MGGCSCASPKVRAQKSSLVLTLVVSLALGVVPWTSLRADPADAPPEAGTEDLAQPGGPEPEEGEDELLRYRELHRDNIAAHALGGHPI